jgi:hypothetical protein
MDNRGPLWNFFVPGASLFLVSSEVNHKPSKLENAIVCITIVLILLAFLLA